MPTAEEIRQYYLPESEQPFKNRADMQKKYGLQENPFTEGTKEYYNFNREQTSDLTNLAGLPQPKDFLPASETGMKDFQKAAGYTPTLMGQPDTVSQDKVLPWVGASMGATTIAGDILGMEALNKFKDRAYGEEPSAWAKLNLSKQRNEEAQRLDEAAKASEGATAEAQSQLGMRGGIGQGAWERLGAAGAENALTAGQKVRSQGVGERLGINIADKEAADKFLSQLPSENRAETGQKLDTMKYLGNLGQTEAAQQADVAFKNAANKMNVEQGNVAATNQGAQYNIGNYLGQLTQERVKQATDYAQQAQAFGSMKTGEGIANSGKK